MGYDIGPKIGIDGEAQYRAQIYQIIQQGKTLASEMKAVASSFDAGTKSEESMAAKSKVLNEQIANQKEKIAALKDGLAKCAEKYGDTDTRTLKWKQSVNEATTSLNKMESESKQSADAVDDVGDSLDDASGKALSFGDVLKANVAGGAILSGLKKVADGIKSAFGQAFNYNQDMENYSTNFKVMLGDQERAVKMVTDLKTMAAKTPFEMSTLADATQTLLAFNVSADDMQGVLKQLGDISLGTPSKMESLTRAFGKMSGSGKVTLEAINMMIDAGYNPLNNIAAKTGESMESLYERISDGAMSFEEIKQAIADATSEGGQFFNGMDEASKTTSGLISTLKDNINEKLGGAFKGVTDKIRNELLPKAIEFVNALDTEKMSASIMNFLDTMQRLTPVIAGAAAAMTTYKIASSISGIVEKLRAATEGQTIAQAALNVVMNANPFVLITTAIVGLVTAFAVLYKTNDDFRAKVDEAWAAIKEIFAAAAQAIGEFFTVTIPAAFQTTIDFVKNNWQALLLLLVNPFAGAFKLLYDNCEGFRNTVNSMVDKVKQAFENMRTGISTTVSNIGNAIKTGIGDAIDWIKSLPAQAIGWGRDFINGMRDGINQSINGIIDSVKGLGSRIRSYLHFSRPDVGPLHDYETWMPDFVTGMARGIDANAYKLQDAVSRMSQSMTISPSVASAAAGNVSTSSVNMGGITIKVYAAQGQSEGGIANAVMERINNAVQRKEGVFA